MRAGTTTRTRLTPNQSGLLTHSHNDTAADFANALDDAEPEARESLIRGVLIRTIDTTGYLKEA